jgi:uncharacterized protein YdhG (YjbR/CyaY superfamily)
VGNLIVIENPLLGRSAKARVNRVCDRHFVEDPYEVCVELLEAQNVWGIRHPPEDWQKERQNATGTQQASTPQAAPQARQGSLAPAEKGGDRETAHPGPQGLLGEAVEQSGGVSQFSMAVNALSRLAGEVNGLTVPPPPDGRDAPGVPQSPAEQLQASDLLALKSLEEKIEERLSQATRELQTQCKYETEQAKADIEELLQEATSVAEARIRKLMEEVLPSLNSQIERSAEEAGREQVEEIKAQTERACRGGADSIRQHLEEMSRETLAEILNAGIQARKIYKEESALAAKAISMCVDSAVDSLNRAGDEAVAEMQAARQALEFSLKKAAEECSPRFAGECNSLLEKFRADAQALSGRLQCEVGSSAAELAEKASRDITAKLEAAVEGALEQVAIDFNKQAEDALELLKEGLRSAQKQCVDEAWNFLDSLRAQVLSETSASTTRVTAEIRNKTEDALRELPDRLYKSVGMAALVLKEWEEEAKTRLEVQARQMLEVFQKELAGLTAAAQEQQCGDAEALQGVLRNRLQQAARLFESSEAGKGESTREAREESGKPPAQPLLRATDRPSPDLGCLVEKQERIVEEALGLFRSRLRQVVADQEPKG